MIGSITTTIFQIRRAIWGQMKVLALAGEGVTATNEPLKASGALPKVGEATWQPRLRWRRLFERLWRG